MLTVTRLFVVSSCLVVAAACLQKDTDHTLYLAPDGSVTWTATEARVYSDEREPAARIAEEASYLADARAATHPVALGLAVLGPERPVRTLVARDERPFTVLTEARFSSVAGLLERLFAEAGLDARVTGSAGGGEGALHVLLDFAAEPAERDSPVSALIDDLEHWSFHMTEGRFVEADGFDLSSGGRRAALSASWYSRAEAASSAKGTIAFSLAWRVE